jgi:8-oxo-dGTP pyrophosphatase MutT (NUDIX family)
LGDPPTSPPLYGLDAFSDDGAVSDDAVTEVRYVLPRVPASSGALIFDGDGRLLILKPNYKKGWTIPGGQIDSNGESPWDACRRETQEECGLEVVRGRLVCVDFRTPKPNRPGGLRFLFDCGTFADSELQCIRLQADEIDDYRLAELDEAAELLSGPIRRRVAAAVGAERCVYLEDGRPVPGVEQ